MPNQAVAVSPACLFCGSANTEAAAPQMHRCFDCSMIWSSCTFDPEIYEGAAKVYDWKLRAGTAVAQQIALFRLGLVAVHCRPGSRVLDIGCGTGDFVGTALDRGYCAVGVEPSQAMRELAIRNLAESYWVHNPDRWICADVPLGVWDAVTLFDVIEHLETPWKALAQLRRQLEPGGVLVIVTPDANEPLRHGMDLADWRHYKPAEHLWLFESKTLHRVLNWAGFEVISQGFDESFVRRDGDRKNLMHVVARRIKG